MFQSQSSEMMFGKPSSWDWKQIIYSFICFLFPEWKVRVYSYKPFQLMPGCNHSIVLVTGVKILSHIGIKFYKFIVECSLITV